MNINLLPYRKELRHKKEVHFKKQLSIVCITAIATLLCWHFKITSQTNTTKKQTARLQQSYLHKQNAATENQPKQERLPPTSSKIAELKAEQVGLAHLFGSLHQGTTANTHLTKLSLKKKNKLFGRTDTMFGITQLIKNLGTATIQKIEKKNGEYNFVLLL